MLPPREGLYHAKVKDIGIDETGPNKLGTCIIRFLVTEELNSDGEWVPCESDGYEITGYFYLEKRDGTVNTITIDALKASLGWDGRDPLWLQDTDLSQRVVQIRVGAEQYNGRERLRVQYINPYGSKVSGAVPKASEDTRRSIANRLGAKLRALAGPATTPPPPPPPPPAKPPTDKAATLAEAWEAFLRSMPAGAPEGEINRQWFAAMEKLFGEKQPDQFTAADWARMRDEAPQHIVPF